MKAFIIQFSLILLFSCGGDNTENAKTNQRMTNPSFQAKVDKLIDSSGISEEKAAELIKIIRKANEETKKVRENHTINYQGKAAEAKDRRAIKEKMEQDIRALLTEEEYLKYAEYSYNMNKSRKENSQNKNPRDWDRTKRDSAKGNRERIGGANIEMLSQKLNLTEEQAQQVKTFLLERTEKMGAMNSSRLKNEDDIPDIQEQRKKVSEEFFAKIRSILDENQVVLFDQLMEKQINR